MNAAGGVVVRTTLHSNSMQPLQSVEAGTSSALGADATSVAVIIPFFQRSAGLLKRALTSICGQRGRFRVTVIVVDDSSPVPAEHERPESVPEHVDIRIVHQPNRGAGVARNTGLDAVPAGTDLVAFLDSDDEWLPTHLQNAAAALGTGYQAYFANYFEPGSERDEFSVHQRLNLSSHRPLRVGEQCYGFEGDMVTQILSANVIETSTVVMRWAAMKSLRFRVELNNSFEDHMYWLEAASGGCRFAFSTLPACRYGTGVSIWRSAAFGSERSWQIIQAQAVYLHAARRQFARSPEQRATVRRRLQLLRRSAATSVLHRFRRHRAFDAGHLLRLFLHDPMSAVLLLPQVLFLTAKYLRDGRL